MRRGTREMAQFLRSGQHSYRGPNFSSQQLATTVYNSSSRNPCLWPLKDPLYTHTIKNKIKYWGEVLWTLNLGPILDPGQTGNLSKVISILYSLPDPVLTCKILPVPVRMHSGEPHLLRAAEGSTCHEPQQPNAIKKRENALWPVAKNKIARGFKQSSSKQSTKSKICIDLVFLSKNSYSNFIVPSITEPHKEVVSD